MEQIFVGFILLVFGGMSAIRPELLVRFQVWTQKHIMGAQYIPSSRTFKAVRILGIILVILGLVNLVGGR